ncbi:MAG: isoprenylcysteine carboxylmethyltransferase family protein [bacterium]
MAKPSPGSGAYVMLGLTALLGGGGLVAFMAFLFAGSPEIVSLGMNGREALWWDAALCAAFFIQHSVMVRRPFRRGLVRLVPGEYASAVYAISSGVVLLAMAALWQKSSETLVLLPEPFRWLLHVTFLLSLAGFFWGTRALGVFDPFGIRPILGRLRGVSPKGVPFTVKGPYRIVRHPLYLCMILMIWSCPDLTWDRVLFNALWTGWIVIASMLEERDLVAEFGGAYLEYQAKVPMLIPRRPRPSASSLPTTRFL